MFTYKHEFRSGPYGDTRTKGVKTKRGFYCSLFNNVAIPPEYQWFNGSYLPHEWGGDYPSFEDIIKWEPIK